MSTKPSTHAEWDTNGTNLSPTTAGHKSDGWATNEIPTAAEFNHWQKQVSDWTKYLYDGDSEFKNLLVTATTRFTGIYSKSITGGTLPTWTSTPVMNSDIDIRGGGLNVTDVYEARITTVGGYGAIGGIAGGVDGQEILITAMDNGLFLKHEDTSSAAANRIYLPGEGSNWADSQFPGMFAMYIYSCARLRYIGSLSRWIIVAVSYVDTQWPIKTMTIPVSMAREFGSPAHTIAENQIILAASANPIIYPINLPAEYYIHSWTLYIEKNTSSASTITARIYSTSNGTITAQATGDTDNQDSIGPTTMTEGSMPGSPLGISYFATRCHYLKVTPSGSISPAADRLYHLNVQYLSYVV